ncbi:hypothetical protein AB6A40_006839 [Gnathostoma spinigerum]|uniref:Uncharacterized protein n=1 Tax=Gnathostoma spinigerum TaxID=75299 RepID=A0ABD6EV59_9BILA
MEYSLFFFYPTPVFFSLLCYSQRSFFGSFIGIQSSDRPYTYIRGCTSTVIAVMDNQPREMEFLFTESICVSLPLSFIWPSIQTDELVHACTCTSDGCNTNMTANASTLHLRLCVILISLIILFDKKYFTL